MQNSMRDIMGDVNIIHTHDKQTNKNQSWPLQKIQSRERQASAQLVKIMCLAALPQGTLGTAPSFYEAPGFYLGRETLEKGSVPLSTEGGAHDVGPRICKGLQLSLNLLLTFFVATSQGLFPFANGHIQLNFSFTFHQENILSKKSEYMSVEIVKPSDGFQNNYVSHETQGR